MPFLIYIDGVIDRSIAVNKIKRIIQFVDACAIMHSYGICVPINRELNSPAAFMGKGDPMNTILKQIEDKINGAFSFYPAFVYEKI